MPKSVRALLVVAAMCCLLVPALALAQETAPPSTPPVVTPAPTTTPTPEEVEAAERKAALAEKRLAKKLRAKVRFRLHQANYWRGVMFKKPLRLRHKLVGVHSSKLRPKLKHWRKVHQRVRYKAKHPPMLWAWECIQSGIKNGRRVGWGEGPWNSSSNPKYDGGLQMDEDFQWTYGARLRRTKGPAYNWTKWEQIWVAIQAWRTRWFYPWPRTARACGLI